MTPLMTSSRKETPMQNKIFLEGLRIYAYHGVIEQERKVGAYFLIDLEVETNFSSAMQSDVLSGTINYADLYDIVKREMAIPSRLIEQVAGRIVNAILVEHSAVQSIRIKIIKENPPIGADCRGAGIEIFYKQ